MVAQDAAMFHNRTSTSIFSWKTSNTGPILCLWTISICVCKLHVAVMHFRTKPIMPKDAQTQTFQTSIGDNWTPTLSRLLFAHGIRRDRAHVQGSASEVSIPTKMWGRDGCSIVYAVSLGGSRYRDEIRVETWALHNPNFFDVYCQV